MLNSTVLEVAIGLVFIYFLFTSLCSAIHEAIASWMGLRARALERAIGQMLGPEYRAELMSHPLIAGTIQAADAAANAAAPNRAKPSYIEPKTFSRALIDVLTGNEPPTFRALEAAVANSTGGVQKAVGALMGGLTTVAGPAVAHDLRADAVKLGEARLNIENWYNGAMERLSGQYKRRTQVVILGIAVAVATIGNLDTLVIVDSLARNATLRASVVALEQRGDAGTSIDQVAGRIEKLQPLGVPMGWPLSGTFSADPVAWVRKVFGLAITVAALTLGAPFWFDLLNLLINVRTTGARPDTDQVTHVPAPLPPEPAPAAMTGPVVVALPGGDAGPPAG